MCARCCAHPSPTGGRRRRLIDSTTVSIVRSNRSVKLCFGDAPDEPSDFVGGVVAIAVACGTLERPVLRVDVDLECPSQLGDGDVESGLAVAREHDLDLAGESGHATSFQGVEHALLPLRLGSGSGGACPEDPEEPSEPRSSWAAEAIGDSMERRRRAEPPSERVLDHRCQRHVVDVARHVDDGSRRAGQPDAVRPVDDVVVGQRRRPEHAHPRFAARVAAGGARTCTRPSRGVRRSSHSRPAVGPATTRWGRLVQSAAHRDNSSSSAPANRYPPSTTRSSTPDSTRRRRASRLMPPASSSVVVMVAWCSRNHASERRSSDTAVPVRSDRHGGDRSSVVASAADPTPGVSR